MTLPYAIDWSATISGFSAFIAAAVAGFTIWWTQRRIKLDALAKQASERAEWIKEFRVAVSEYLASFHSLRATYVLNGEVIFPASAEVTFSHMRKYHHLCLLLPFGQPHFDALRAKIYEVDIALIADSQKLNKHCQDIEFTAAAVIEVERKSALQNMFGRSL